MKSFRHLVTSMICLCAFQLAGSTDWTCGTPAFPSGKIINGEEAVPNSWPWVVEMRLNHPSRGWTHWCGGVVIHKDWILTAAHCLYDRIGGHIVDFSSPGHYHRIELVLGEHNLFELEGPEYRVRPIEVVVHEGAKFKDGDRSYVNDIALIKINATISFNDYMQPICLSRTSWIKPKENSYIAGWGTSDPFSIQFFTHVLNQAVVPLIDTEICKRPEYYDDYILPGMICAGYENGSKDSCRGDSGGPMFAWNPSNQSYYLIGLTSWGFGCALPMKPGVYTNVTFYYDWILNKIDEGQCEPVEAPGNGTVADCDSHVGAVCTFTCNKGYFMAGGNSTRTCTASGWTGSPLVCRDITCSPLSAPANAAWVRPCSNSFGSVCHSVCTAGYELSAGDQYRTCTAEGWNGTQAICTKKTVCTNLQEKLTNGRLACNEFNDRYMFCRVICDSGHFYPYNINKYLTCGRQTNFEWSHKLKDREPQLPKCTRGYFADLVYPVKLYYKSSTKCEKSMLMKPLSTKILSAINSAEQCNKSCKLRELNTSCSNYGAFDVTFQIVLPSVVPDKIPTDCSVSCIRQKLYMLLHQSRRLEEQVKFIIANEPQMFESSATMKLKDATFLSSRRQLACKEGKCLSGWVCLPCLEGEYLDKEVKRCLPCPIGTYQDKQGQVTCQPCPVGTTAKPGSYLVEHCINL